MTSAAHRRPPVDPFDPAPSQAVGGDGTPAFGGYAGIVSATGLDHLAAPYRLGPSGPLGLPRRYVREKRWVYCFAATDEVSLVAALVNGAVTGSGFCMATDLRTGAVIAESSRMGALARVNDHPGPGLRATYRLPGTRYEVARDGDTTRWTVRLANAVVPVPRLASPWLEVDLAMRETGTGITAVAEVRRGGESTVSVTAKACGLPVAGGFRVHADGGVTAYDLTGGFGGYDMTRGSLPRHTAWRWAFGTGRIADGTVVGFNLTEGFSGVGERSREGAVWVDGRPHPVDPRLRFAFDRGDVRKPWQITSADGSVRLRFDPIAEHRELVDVRVLRSSFVQPVGHFSGELEVAGRTIALDGLPGVVEDQDIVW
jgi:hypothetical protein